MSDEDIDDGMVAMVDTYNAWDTPDFRYDEAIATEMKSQLASSSATG